MITVWRIVKEEHNFLINPNHPNYPTMTIVDPQQFNILTGSTGLSGYFSLRACPVAEV